MVLRMSKLKEAIDKFLDSTVGMLILLLVIDTIIGVSSYSSLPLSRGMMVFGDLTGFYTFTFPGITTLSVLELYPILEWLLHIFVGPISAQNILFLSSFFLPSIGMYLFFIEVHNEKVVCLISAIILGTLLNPLLLAMFNGGGLNTVSGYSFHSCLLNSSGELPVQRT